MGYLSDYFDFIVTVASSAVYLCIKPIPESLFDNDIYWSLSLSEKEHYFDQAVEIGLTPEEKEICGLIKAVLYNDFGLSREADDLIKKYKASHLDAEARIKYLQDGMNWNRDSDKW